MLECIAECWNVSRNAMRWIMSVRVVGGYCGGLTTEGVCIDFFPVKGCSSCIASGSPVEYEIGWNTTVPSDRGWVPCHQCAAYISTNVEREGGVGEREGWERKSEKASRGPLPRHTPPVLPEHSRYVRVLGCFPHHRQSARSNLEEDYTLRLIRVMISIKFN